MCKAPKPINENNRFIDIGDDEEDKEEEKELIVKNGSLIVIDKV
eukprot:CAMPEP_0202958408 /NCGR_PEP_ID=MMETSP1396-20130829/2763_1 /ASSEMBLY_ACC=CAM_ASM_000872 /TAXON_ID= /ORGANISM="Pseudokeronopsis sp., Strain Brazil" /LENGTH=43 /DNA_ID= /DNA_START= /DNA_END= /DNA_ORIENTATION=